MEMQMKRRSKMADIISKWPSVAEFAKDLGIEYSTAHTWRQRGLTDARRLLDIVKAAEKRGFDGVTLEKLANIAKRESKDPPRKVA
jgi:hypothetical protein